MTQTANPNDTLLSDRASLARGAAIGKLMRQALQFPELISLAAGFVDNSTLPCDPVQRCVNALAADASKLRDALQYDATAGNLELREVLADWSSQEFPESKPETDRIILSAGSNQFLHLLSETILDPGDIVLVAEPTYFVFLGTLKGIGARVIGVPADSDGICVEALSEKLECLRRQGEGPKVKAIYSVTEFDNPAGSTLSLERREAIVELVSKWRREVSPLLLLSDNAYHLLRYHGEAIAPFAAIDGAAREFVVELGTFSKSFSPGIRVGWGVVPPDLVPPLLEMKSNIDFGSPHLNQSLMLEALTSGEVDRHLPTIREGYHRKLESMLDALQSEFGSADDVRWRKPKGGLYVWVELPDHVDTSEGGVFWETCLELGVLYVPGHHCFSRDSTAPHNTMRLSFGVQCEQGIRKGISLLRQAFDRVTAS